MPKWCPAKVTRKDVWTDGLFTLHVQCPELKSFTPGQFLQLAVVEDDKRINRPYSVASPFEETIEFFIVLVEDGELTPKLWALEPGDEVEVSEKAAGMNAFGQDWDGEHVWLCPPVNLVVAAVKHLLLSEDCSGVLCCPLWKTGHYWTLLAPDGVHFAGFVENFTCFRPKYFSGGAVRSRMFTGVPKWQTLAVFIRSGEGNSGSIYKRSHCLNGGCDRCL